MKRIRPLELAALLTGFLIVAFPQTGAGELKPDTISPARFSGSGPRIDSDGSGNVVAVWRELDDDEAAIRAAIRPKNGSFGPSERISVPSVAAESPQVAMDRLGNAVAVWQQSTNGRDSVVEAAIRPAGGEWSAPGALSDPGEAAYNADVEIADGKATAVWVGNLNRMPIIRSASRTMTGSWSHPEPISGPVGATYSPAVALDDHGSAVAAWQLNDGANRLIQAAVRSTDGSWSQPEELSGPGRDASAPVVAMDGAGNALVGWIRGNGIWTAAQIATRPAGGAWGPPRNLSRRGRNAGSIELAMNRRGDAMVAWVQGLSLFTSFRPAGEEGWRRTSVTGHWYALRAKIALDETGNATAVWSGGFAVSASYKPEGEAWQDDYLLSGYDTEASSVTPEVTAQSTDNAMAIWVSEEESDDRIQAVAPPPVSTRMKAATTAKTTTAVATTRATETTKERCSRARLTPTSSSERRATTSSTPAAATTSSSAVADATSSTAVPATTSSWAAGAATASSAGRAVTGFSEAAGTTSCRATQAATYSEATPATTRFGRTTGTATGPSAARASTSTTSTGGSIMCGRSSPGSTRALTGTGRSSSGAARSAGRR